MFGRLLWESFARQRRRKLLAGLAILLGTTAVTAMLALATTVGDRIHRELAVYGANLVITPKADTLEVKVGDQVLKPATGGAVLRESDLAKLRTIFWANNITGVSPELHFDAPISSPGRAQVMVPAVGLWFDHKLGDGSSALMTGAPKLHTTWSLMGQWPRSANEVVLGHELANRLGVTVGNTVLVAAPSPLQEAYPLHVSGVVDADNTTNNTMLLQLVAAQRLTGQPDAVSRVEVSARTKPEDAFARKDPDSLSPKQHEIWYCRPYANSIAYQIREAIPGAQAEPLRQVEQSEGTILERISGLLWLVSAAALIAAAVAVSAAMATAVLERRAEVGLMRSLGASRGRIASLFYAEAGLLAVLGGLLGYALGSFLAAALTARIFDHPLERAAQQAGNSVGAAFPSHVFNPVLLPVVLLLALLVAIAGSTASIRAALRLSPTSVLRADA